MTFQDFSPPAIAGLMFLAVLVLPALWDWKHRARLTDAVTSILPAVLHPRRNGATSPRSDSDDERWVQNQRDHERAFGEIKELSEKLDQVMIDVAEIRGWVNAQGND